MVAGVKTMRLRSDAHKVAAYRRRMKSKTKTAHIGAIDDLLHPVPVAAFIARPLPRPLESAWSGSG